ncbi:RidA family protein [Gulosibacter chungangensis]|uniref:RidA family protein n=1 Tax=Gulosibacter chungangensis TaxID=979746 RepID=A0A7J5BCN6_9MICO|nr:RidA family protein [Gulosibacter chungangensis]KAB1643950.1 RidA family protein [Gulosibacter chungangensis]
MPAQSNRNHRRRSIYSPGFSHENPIPAASKIGPYVFSGVLTGRDPQTGQLGDDLAAQCRHVFTHVRNVMAAAGGSTDDIAKLNVWLVDYRDREALNAEWLAMFPDAESRPARQVMAAQLDRGALIQVDLVAILPDAS